MSIKLIAAVVFILIIISLGSALFQILRSADSEHSAKALKALKLRIGLSIILFLILVVAVSLGWIQPTGIGARMQQVRSGTQAQPEHPATP